MYNIIMLCTRVKTHNFTDISAKQFFFYLKTVLCVAGVDPVVKNTYLAAQLERKKMIIYTTRSSVRKITMSPRQRATVFLYSP